MSFFGRLWRGDTSFPATFWVGGVLGTLVFGLAKTFLFTWAALQAVIEAGASPQEIMGMPDPFLQAVLAGQLTAVIFAIVELLYFVLMTSAIWRSGDKFDGAKVWPILAKIVLAVGWISYIYNYYGALTV